MVDDLKVTLCQIAPSLSWPPTFFIRGDDIKNTISGAFQ